MSLSTTYIFQAIAFSSSSLHFISELGRRFQAHSTDVWEGSFLFQRISIAAQRINSVLLHETLVANLSDS